MMEMEMPKQYFTKAPTNYAEYLGTPDEERWEIINGVPYNMTPAPSRQHQKITGNLHLAFGNYLHKKTCDVYISPFDVRLFTNGKNDNEIKDVVQPDLTIVCDPSKLDDRGCNGAPDLVVEVLSPSTFKRDKVEKLYLYRKAKVKEYWIIDLDREAIEIFRFDDDPDKFPDIQIYTLKDNDKVQVGIFDDLTIDLQDVFA